MKSGHFGYLCMAICCLALGYVMGTSGIGGTQSVLAFDEEKKEESTLPEEVQEKVKLAIEAVETARSALEGEGLYNPATTELNTFAITCGGVDALADLERGTGVDPETFAGLYADKAVDEISENIAKDDKGRITYKGKVVRMYSLSKITKMLEQREILSGKDALDE